MSANLNSGAASTSDNAAALNSSTAGESAVSTAESPAVNAPGTAASEQSFDARIASVRNQYKENLLDDSGIDHEPEPKDTPEPKEPEPEPIAAREADEPEEVEDDSLLEERTGPRTIDDINKQYPRAPIPVREEIAKLETEKWELQAQVNELGGTVGMGIAKELLPAILNVSPDEKVAESVFEALTLANPGLVQQMSSQLLSHALTEDSIDTATGLPFRIATGNALIKEHLDPDYDVEKIEELIAWDKAGLLDHEKLKEESELYSGPTAREKELEARLKTLEDEKSKDRVAQEQAQQVAQRQHYDKAINHLQTRVLSAALPIAEQFGWTATKEEKESSDPNVRALAESKIAMGRMLTDHLNAELHRYPEWAAVDELAKRGQAFNADDNPTALYARNSEALANRILATFKGLVRTLNPTFAKSFGSTRNVQLKQKIRSGPAEPPAVPPVQKVAPVNNRTTFQEKINATQEAYRQGLRQARG